MKQNTSTRGQDVIEQEMLTLRAEIDGLLAFTNETENSMETCVVGLEQYAVEQAQFAEWLEVAERKVQTKAEPVEYESPEQQLVELEVCSNNFLS